MPYLTAPDGARLYYEIEGEGPPVILHLGAGCDLETWRAAGYVDRLAPTNRCILFDHRGHGRSDHPAGAVANHIDRYAADMVRLLDVLKLESARFWGYSNAIAVGLKVADARPGRIDRLVHPRRRCPLHEGENHQATHFLHLDEDFAWLSGASQVSVD